MKFHLQTSMLVLGIILLLVSGSVWAAGVKYVLGVDGLSCPFCAFGLEKKLKKVKNVQSVSIDMNKGQVLVTAKADSTVEKDDLRKAVKDAGFSVSYLKKVESDTKGGELQLRRDGGQP